MVNYFKNYLCALSWSPLNSSPLESTPVRLLFWSFLKDGICCDFPFCYSTYTQLSVPISKHVVWWIPSSTKQVLLTLQLQDTWMLLICLLLHVLILFQSPLLIFPPQALLQSSVLSTVLIFICLHISWRSESFNTCISNSDFFPKLQTVSNDPLEISTQILYQNAKLTCINVNS